MNTSWRNKSEIAQWVLKLKNHSTKCKIIGMYINSNLDFRTHIWCECDDDDADQGPTVSCGVRLLKSILWKFYATFPKSNYKFQYLHWLGKLNTQIHIYPHIKVQVLEIVYDIVFKYEYFFLCIYVQTLFFDKKFY